MLERLRFVRGLRRRIDDELDREEHALLGLLKEAGVSWRELAEAEYGTSLNAVAQHYTRLGKRIGRSPPKAEPPDRR